MTLARPMRCSVLAEELGEPMAGTTEQRVRWILVEDHGAWGDKAVRDLLGAEVEAEAKARGTRLLLVRRREGPPALDARRRVFVVDTEARRAVRGTVGELTEVAALLDVPLDGWGEPHDDPIFLVCTNGRRDACCALRGRALVSALSAAHGERTWECTHLGGHRFAGNLVCLPDGVVYGRVGPEDGPRVASAFLGGDVVPSRMRGRAAWPGPAQAAEVALRTSGGRTGRSDVVLRSVSVEGDAARVELEVAGEVHGLELRAERLAPRAISCRADELESPLHWSVVGSA